MGGDMGRLRRIWGGGSMGEAEVRLLHWRDEEDGSRSVHSGYI